MPTQTRNRLADIDEALMHASLVPEAERGTAWQTYTNGLLEQRRKAEPNPHPTKDHYLYPCHTP